MSANLQRSTLFDLAGGHPALNLVNSLDNRFRADGPNEMLTGFAELVRFLRETALITPDQAQLFRKKINHAAAGHVLQSVTELREASAAVLYAVVAEKTPPARDLRTLERYFHAADGQRRLCWESGATWKWAADESNPELAVWILARSVCELLFSEQLAQMRACGVATCRWLFLDTSKNHSRRWCNMKVCGNRVKARRFQEAARDRAASEEIPSGGKRPI
jgi:predicted RNA-binding Zn ribbon-like protein